MTHFTSSLVALSGKSLVGLTPVFAQTAIWFTAFLIAAHLA